jgi:hypothetical protein
VLKNKKGKREVIRGKGKVLSLGRLRKSKNIYVCSLKEDSFVGDFVCVCVCVCVCVLKNKRGKFSC